MDYGLLGSFQNIMADLTPEELEQANNPAPPEGPPIAEAEAPVPPPESSPSDGVFGGRSRSHVEAPPIDERARQLAARLASQPTATLKPTGDHWEVDVPGNLRIRLDRTNPGPVLIGRGGPDDSPRQIGHLTIDLAVASRSHCQIDLVDNHAGVVDLGSTNGTTIYRSGMTIDVGSQRVPLKPGDVITTAGGAAVLATIGTVGS